MSIKKIETKRLQCSKNSNALVKKCKLALKAVHARARTLCNVPINWFILWFNLFTCFISLKWDGRRKNRERNCIDRMQSKTNKKMRKIRNTGIEIWIYFRLVVGVDLLHSCFWLHRFFSQLHLNCNFIRVEFAEYSQWKMSWAFKILLEDSIDMAL